MRTRLTLLAATAALALTLAGCSSSDGGGSDTGSDTSSDASAPATAESPSAAAEETAMAADLATASTSLGTIVVDGRGMTAYYFTKDTQDSGTSACTGDCLAAWPPVTTTSATPTVDGITAEVGTIPTPDGALQVTIDGRPVYLFAKDAAPGDVNGQGVSGVWWVIAPDGAEIGG